MIASSFFQTSIVNIELSPLLHRNKEFDELSYNGIRIPDACSEANDDIG